MKKLFMFASLMCLGLMPQFGSADGVQYLDTNCNGVYEPGEVDPNCEYQSGPCVCDCPYTKFQPQYYCTTHNEYEAYTVNKPCTRYVPQYYNVTKCRYVPQYYQVQCCRQVPEQYCVQETKYRCKPCQDWHCKYVPYTYHKKTCCWPNQDQQCGQGCAAPASCAPQGCSAGGCPTGGYSQPQGYYSQPQGQQYSQPMKSNGNNATPRK